MQKIHSLDFHLTHRCNMACTYCSHFCNYGINEDIDFQVGSEWIRAWSKRIVPDFFFLLGGEPLLHTDLDKYILLAAECYPQPEVQRRVQTNGLLLRKIEHLFPLFIETNTWLGISLHPVDKKREPFIHDALLLAYAWMSKGLKLHIRGGSDKWIASYKGEGLDILPFMGGHPETSWENCPSRDATSLVNGRLYQCPFLAYLPLILDRLSTRKHWEAILEYTPLTLAATDQEIATFFTRNVSGCGLCALEPQYVAMPPAPYNMYGALRSRYYQLYNEKAQLEKQVGELKRELECMRAYEPRSSDAEVGQ